MGGLLALILGNLPTIIDAAKDVSTVVSAVESVGSAFTAVKKAFPDVATTIEAIGKELPMLPGASDLEHLDSITKSLFGGQGWSADQQQAWWDRASNMNDA